MKTILNKQQIENKILRISFEIIEGNLDANNILLIGLEKNGFIIAKKIQNFANNHKNIYYSKMVKMKRGDCNFQ